MSSNLWVAKWVEGSHEPEPHELRKKPPSYSFLPAWLGMWCLAHTLTAAATSPCYLLPRAPQQGREEEEPLESGRTEQYPGRCSSSPVCTGRARARAMGRCGWEHSTGCPEQEQVGLNPGRSPAGKLCTLARTIGKCRQAVWHGLPRAKAGGARPHALHRGLDWVGRNTYTYSAPPGQALLHKPPAPHSSPITLG